MNNMYVIEKPLDMKSRKQITDSKLLHLCIHVPSNMYKAKLRTTVHAPYMYVMLTASTTGAFLLTQQRCINRSSSLQANAWFFYSGSLLFSLTMLKKLTSVL